MLRDLLRSLARHELEALVKRRSAPPRSHRASGVSGMRERPGPWPTLLLCVAPPGAPGGGQTGQTVAR